MIKLNPFAIAGLLIAFTCLGLIVILVRYGTTKVHRLWIFFNLAVGIWGIGVFFIATSPTEDLAIISWQLALSGGILIPVFFFHVVSIFCERKNKIVIIFAYLQGLFFISIYLFFPRNILSQYKYLFNSFYYIRAIHPLFSALTFFGSFLLSGVITVYIDFIK